MKFRTLTALIAAATAVAAGPGHAKPAPGMTRGVSNALLAQAARRTLVRAVDYDQDRCDPRTVGQWFTALAGPEARAITWRGGPCKLVGPGIDSGSRWCAQGVVTLAHPQSRDDKPTIEIFFEQPVGGRPGQAYAFRGAMTAADGPDMSRFRHDFEADWASRFTLPRDAVIDCPPP